MQLIKSGRDFQNNCRISISLSESPPSIGSLLLPSEPIDVGDGTSDHVVIEDDTDDGTDDERMCDNLSLLRLLSVLSGS